MVAIWAVFMRAECSPVCMQSRAQNLYLGYVYKLNYLKQHYRKLYKSMLENGTSIHKNGTMAGRVIDSTFQPSPCHDSGSNSTYLPACPALSNTNGTRSVLALGPRILRAASSISWWQTVDQQHQVNTKYRGVPLC